MNVFEKIKKFGETQWEMAILLAVPVFLALSPILLGLKAFFHIDTSFILYPAYTFFQNSLLSGESILWNPLNFGGFPGFAGVAAGFQSPLHALFFRYLPVLEAYHYLTFLYMLAAAFFISACLKEFGVRGFAAYLGGLSYAFMQWRTVNDLPIVAVVPLLPLLFFALLRISRGKNIWLLFGGLGSGLILLAGHYHLLMEVFIAMAVFSFYIPWAVGNTKKYAAIRSLFSFFMMAGLGFLIASARFLATFLYIGFSSRADPNFLQFAPAGLSFLDPLQFFSPYLETPYSIHSLLSFSGEQKYIGILPILFLASALAFRGSDRMRKFFSFFLLFSLLAAIQYSPFGYVFQFVPGLHLLTYPGRWMFIAYFAAAMLVAIGFDGFFANREAGYLKRFEKIFWRVGLGIIFFLISGWVALFVFGSRVAAILKGYFDTRLYSTGSYVLPIEHYHQYIERVFYDSRSMFNIFSPKVFLPAAFFFISFIVVRKYRNGAWDPLFSSKVALVVVIANLVSVFAFFHILASPSVINEIPDTARHIRELQEAGGGRAMPFLPGQTEFFKLSVPSRNRPSVLSSTRLVNELLYPNVNLLYGVESLDYFDNFMSRRGSRLIAYLGATYPTAGEALVSQDLLPEEKVRILETRKNLINFSGVQYIVSAYSLDESRFPKIFETTIIPPYNIEIGIYENREARPRFYFADSVEVIPENEIAAFEKLKAIPEEGLGVFVECPFESAKLKMQSEKLNPCGEAGLTVDGKGTLEIKTKKNTVSILKTKSETHQFLLFSENNLPGWKAYVDGVETPIYMTGSVYMGTSVPKGEHEVRFEFTYRTIINEFMDNIKLPLLLLND